MKATTKIALVFGTIEVALFINPVRSAAQSLEAPTLASANLEKVLGGYCTNDPLFQAGRKRGKPSETLPGHSRNPVHILSTGRIGASQIKLYWGRGPGRETFCGIAQYGPTSRQLVRRLEEFALNNGYVPFPPETYLPHTHDADKVSYWGDARARSMIGLTMIQRQPNSQWPTVEFEYHAISVP